jgi:hypothetical protein
LPLTLGKALGVGHVPKAALTLPSSITRTNCCPSIWSISTAHLHACLSTTQGVLIGTSENRRLRVLSNRSVADQHSRIRCGADEKPAGAIRRNAAPCVLLEMCRQHGQCVANVRKPVGFFCRPDVSAALELPLDRQLLNHAPPLIPQGQGDKGQGDNDSVNRELIAPAQRDFVPAPR